MRVHLALLTTVLLFGAAFPAIRAGLSGYSVGHLVLLRFLTASLILLVVWMLRGRPRPAVADLPLIAFVGVIVTCIYPLLLGFGELSVDAGTASILVNLSPIFTAILASLFLRERVRAIACIGIVIAFAGAILAAGGAHLQLTRGAMLVVGAAFAQGVQFVAMKSLLRRYDAFSLTTFMVWSGTLVDLLFARGFVSAIAHAPLESTLAILGLGAFATVVAVAAWSYALSRVPSAHAAVFLYLVPPIAIVIGALWLREVPSAAAVIGGAITMFGVFLSTRRGADRHAGVARLTPAGEVQRRL